MRACTASCSRGVTHRVCVVGRLSKEQTVNGFMNVKVDRQVGGGCFGVGVIRGCVLV